MVRLLGGEEWWGKVVKGGEVVVWCEIGWWGKVVRLLGGEEW